MEGDTRIRKLRWMCRRGMKELDVLFEAFLAREREALARGGWPELEALLQREDDLIWDWIQLRRRPDSPELEALIGALRERA